MVDDSVEGNVSVDLVDVPVQLALQALATQHRLHYAMRGNNTLMVYSGATLTDRELRRTHTDIIPLKYANAAVLANILNSTVFAQQQNQSDVSTTSPSSRSSSNNAMMGNNLLAITPDFRTNSLIIVGTERDVTLAREYVGQLDIPRSSRTWRLSHADALEVSAILSASLFNEGTSPLLIGQGGAGGAGGGAGGAGGAGGGAGGGMMAQPGQMPSMLRVRSETIAEGSELSIGADGGSSGGSSEGGSGGGGERELRTTTKTDEIVQVSPQGVLIVPDTRLNAITVLGTQRQLALAENLIARLDQPAPQVMIEASLIEISENSLKELGFNLGINYEEFSTSFDGLNSLFSFNTADRNVTSRIDVSARLNALIQNNRAKLLANPNLITIHDKEAAISIVDEIVESVTVTLDNTGAGGVLGTETNIGNVGIVLDILPKVGANGDITMRVQPSLSTVANVVTDPNGNLITLLSRREAAGQQIKLKDGQTFVMGGLLQETDTNAVAKYPFLSNIPILGALARNSSRNRQRTELLIVLTPHVVKEELNGPGILPAPVEPRVINAMSVEMPRQVRQTPAVDMKDWKQRRQLPEENSPVRGMWAAVDEAY
jgi:type IV pilus assembly protein PilQ